MERVEKNISCYEVNEEKSPFTEYIIKKYRKES